MKRILTTTALILACAIASAQTHVGTMSHIANALGNDTSINEGSPLKGEWKFGGCISEPADTRLCATADNALQKSGMYTGEASLIFGDGAAFAFTNGESTMPGTWMEKDGRIKISFSKIFSYAMMGEVSGDTILFEAEAFTGFIQRALCLMGRSDTNETVKAMTALPSSGTKIGIKLIR